MDFNTTFMHACMGNKSEKWKILIAQPRVHKFVDLSVALSVMFFSTLNTTLNNNKQHKVVLNN